MGDWVVKNETLHAMRALVVAMNIVVASAYVRRNDLQTLAALRDNLGELVAPIEPMPSPAIGPNNGRPTVLTLSPAGVGAAGNVTVLVTGAAFRDFGVPPCHSLWLVQANSLPLPFLYQCR